MQIMQNVQTMQGIETMQTMQTMQVMQEGGRGLRCGRCTAGRRCPSTGQRPAAATPCRASSPASPGQSSRLWSCGLLSCRSVGGWVALSVTLRLPVAGAPEGRAYTIGAQGGCTLLRLADFCGASGMMLAKIRALRHSQPYHRPAVWASAAF